MNKSRCPRCLRDQLYIDYHDHERWVPVHDDVVHFEFLLLESFQAWLSWYTILTKRENFRLAFDNFDPVRISQYSSSKIEELMSNTAIIRHHGKILATITNAQIFLDIQHQYGSWDKYIRSYFDWQVIHNHVEDYQFAPPTSLLSDQISRDLKKLGMKFLWSTTVYSYLQAVWIINDHEITCRKHHNT